MLDRQADTAYRCRSYTFDAYRSVGYGQGIINHLDGTHKSVFTDVRDYFGEVKDFSEGQAERVREAVELYETTDFEISEMLDASLFNPERRTEVQELGRTAGLDPCRDAAIGSEPVDPVDSLRPLINYRAELPVTPQWYSEIVGIGMARKVVWEITWYAAELGWFPKAYDIAVEPVAPYIGDWAYLKSCGDALANLADAGRGLHTNIGWLEQRIDAVWKGNAADACWLQVRKLQLSVQHVPDVLDGYATAYRDVVTRVKELERIVGEVVEEVIDWAIVALLGWKAALAKGAVLLAWPTLPLRDFVESLREPIAEIAKRIFYLTDLIQLSLQAVYSFEARVKMGLLHGPELETSMPTVPRPSGGYT